MLARPWKFWRTALEPAEGRQKNGWSACLLQENWCWHGQGICSAQEMRAGRPGPANSTAKRWECEEGGEDRHVNPLDTGWSRCWHHTMRDCAALRLAAPGIAEAAEALQRAQHVWCTSMLDKHGRWTMCTVTVMTSMGHQRADTCAPAAAAIAGQGLCMAPLLLMHLPQRVPGKGVGGILFQNPGQHVSCSLQQCRDASRFADGTSGDAQGTQQVAVCTAVEMHRKGSTGGAMTSDVPPPNPGRVQNADKTKP